MLILWRGKTYGVGDKLPSDLQAIKDSRRKTSTGSERGEQPPEPVVEPYALTLINSSDDPLTVAAIPGIGVASAEVIILHRLEHGEFESLDAVKAVVSPPRADWELIASWSGE